LFLVLTTFVTTFATVTAHHAASTAPAISWGQNGAKPAGQLLQRGQLMVFGLV
jgi:hypothetical protein